MTSAPDHPLELAGVPGLWHRAVVSRLGIPAWAASVALFAVLYAGSVALAALNGQLAALLEEPRSWLRFSLVATSAFIIGYVPAALTRLWRQLQPWVSLSSEEFGAAATVATADVTRFSWVGYALGAGAGLWFALVDPQSIRVRMAPATFHAIGYLALPFYTYFCGSALTIVAWGLTLLARAIGRRMPLKAGFFLHDGKASLRPFNNLQWALWGLFLMPLSMILFITAAVGAHYNMFMGLSLATIVGSIAVPQLFMNQWLHEHRLRDVAGLRQELALLVAVPAHADAAEVQRRLLRHQHTAHELTQVQASPASLVDTNFVLQIVVSVAGILLADIILRAVVN